MIEQIEYALNIVHSFLVSTTIFLLFIELLFKGIKSVLKTYIKAIK